jgi:hypothetical protein
MKGIKRYKHDWWITCDGIEEGLGEGEKEDGGEAMESCLVNESLNAFNWSIASWWWVAPEIVLKGKLPL